MRRVLAAAFLLSLLTTASYAQDKRITVSGCVIRGVEPGCLVLLTTPGTKRYNISAAQPMPAPGSYGTVTGTLRPHWITFCQQGEVIEPATWKYRGPLCPLAKGRHKR